MDTSEICRKIIEGQIFRRGAIRTLTALKNGRLAQVRLALGFYEPGADYDEIKARSQKLVKDVLAGKETGARIEIIGLIEASRDAFRSLESYRKLHEGKLEKLAKQLPVWPWVESVRGVGPLGLAVIVGETGELGDIGAYRTVQGFWKRHGFGVIDGIRQQKRTDPEQAEKHGYSPRRHAEAWAFLQDVMIRAQWQGGKPLGPYGEKYQRKKLEYASREDTDEKGRRVWTPLHVDRAARRYAAKAFLTDLYYEWRQRDQVELVAPRISRPAVDMARKRA